MWQGHAYRGQSYNNKSAARQALAHRPRFGPWVACYRRDPGSDPYRKGLR